MLCAMQNCVQGTATVMCENAQDRDVSLIRDQLQIISIASSRCKTGRMDTDNLSGLGMEKKGEGKEGKRGQVREWNDTGMGRRRE